MAGTVPEPGPRISTIIEYRDKRDGTRPGEPLNKKQFLVVGKILTLETCHQTPCRKSAIGADDQMLLVKGVLANLPCAPDRVTLFSTSNHTVTL